MKISIRWALVLGFLAAIWGTHAVTVTSSYVTSEQVLLKHARDIMANIAESAMAESRNHLALAQGAALLTRRLIRARVVDDGIDGHERLERYFYDQLATHPHFAGIYLGTPDGDFLYVSRDNAHGPDGFRTKIVSHATGERQVSLVWRDAERRETARRSDPADTYDPRIRPWYKDALARQGIVWTDPYIFYTAQTPGITIAGPIYGTDRQLRGVVGVDLQIDQLSAFMAKLHIGANGRAFLISRNGEVVAYPDISKITRTPDSGNRNNHLVHIADIQDPIAQKAFAAVDWQRTDDGRLRIDGPTFAAFDHNGRRYTATFTPFSNHRWQWIVGVYLPENDYLGGLKTNRRLNVYITLGISAVATVLALLLARGIIRPITALERAARSIRDHSPMTEPPIASVYAELDETAHTFHRMHESLKRQEVEKTRLEAQVRQSQKMEAIGTLAGGVAHDFNNILYPIIGFTEMALNEIGETNPGADHLREVLIAGRRAKSLVDQILTFSRRESPEPTVMNAASAVREVVGLLRATIPSTIAIVETIDDRCGPILADPTQIQQVIMNLATNAFHSMKRSGGTLTICLSAIQMVDDNLRDHGESRSIPHVKLTVADTGIGIPDEIRDRIFEPYFTTKPVGEGTGMGLAVVHGILARYGGSIQVESTPGQGSRFHVYLPQTDQPLPSGPQTAEPPTAIYPARVMVVDDEPQIARMLEQQLTAIGYRITVVSDSQTALEMFAHAPESYDMVITDMTMPHMTGDQLAEAMLALRRDIPILLCTGFSEWIDERRSLQIGIREMIYKPVVIADLAQIMCSILDKAPGPTPG